MKHARLAAVLLGLALGTLPAWAYEPGFLNLDVPARLSPGDLDVLFEHRFFGSILDNPLQTLFGLSVGANVGFGARLMIVPGLLASASYVTDGQELDVGAGYGYTFPKLPLALQAEASFISPQGLAGRGYGAFVSLEGEVGPIAQIVYVDAAAAYDSYLNHLGTGIGARVELSPSWALIAEVYPFFLLGNEQHPEELGVTTAWSAGVMWTIGGHQFCLMAGSSPALGERRLMAGAPPFGGIYLGFNIQRLFSIG